MGTAVLGTLLYVDWVLFFQLLVVLKSLDIAIACMDTWLHDYVCMILWMLWLVCIYAYHNQIRTLENELKQKQNACMLALRKVEAEASHRIAALRWVGLLTNFRNLVCLFVCVCVRWLHEISFVCINREQVSIEKEEAECAMKDFQKKREEENKLLEMKTAAEKDVRPHGWTIVFLMLWHVVQ